MRQTESVVYTDILEQTSTLPRTLEALEDVSLPEFIFRNDQSFVFTGCGSSYYAAQCGAQLMRTLSNAPTYAVPSSEVWLLPELWLKEGSILVAISRTGTTTEVLRAMEQARERRIPTISISLGTEVPMYDLADFSMELSHVQETGRPMTQSFSNMLIAAQWLSIESTWEASRPHESEIYRKGLRDAIHMVTQQFSKFEELARAIVQGDNVQQYVFLGSGPFTGLCNEAALKVEEMARVSAKGYATMEYRHGPIATLTEHSVAFFASCAKTSIFDVLVSKDILSLGGTAVVVGPEEHMSSAPDGVQVVVLPDGLPDWLYGNVALPFFQLIAYQQAIALDEDPNSIRHLDRNLNPHINPHIVDLHPPATQ